MLKRVFILKLNAIISSLTSKYIFVYMLGFKVVFKTGYLPV